MKTKLKALIITTIIFLSLSYTTAYAQFRIPNPSVCEDMGCVLDRLGDFLRPLAAISFLLMFTYGGFLYMTGSDNDDQIQKAKTVMTGAAIGIVLILAAPALTNFTLSLFRSTFVR